MLEVSVNEEGKTKTVCISRMNAIHPWREDEFIEVRIDEIKSLIWNLQEIIDMED